MYKAFLIDLDGTAYLGNEVIKETVTFVKDCKERNIKIMFVTNNASATINQIYSKLANMGYEISKEEILTSAIVMGKFYKEQQRNNKPYVIADQGLLESLKTNKIDFVTDLDYELVDDLTKIEKLKDVIIGYTNKATYKDLGVASLILQKEDSNLYATNKDMILPNNLGKLPGNGSLINILETVSTKEALNVGKPTKIILDYALELLNLKKEEVCMIGDNYSTDILFGIKNNIDTIFVEGGVSTLEYVDSQKLQPTYKIKNLSYFKIEGE